MQDDVVSQATIDLLALQQSAAESNILFSFLSCALQAPPYDGSQSWAHFIPDQSANHAPEYSPLLRELQYFGSIHGIVLQHSSIVSCTGVDAGGRLHLAS